MIRKCYKFYTLIMTLMWVMAAMTASAFAVDDMWTVANRIIVDVYEGHTDLAPYEFFECCNEKSDDEILGAAVQHYDVVEIDDGIKPAFFYKTEHGYELLFSFDAKTAKKNIREEID